METKPDNVIEFETVSKEEALKVGSPAEQPKPSLEQLDAKFAVIPKSEPHETDISRSKEILANLTEQKTEAYLDTDPSPSLSSRQGSSIGVEKIVEKIKLLDSQARYSKGTRVFVGIGGLTLLGLQAGLYSAVGMSVSELIAAGITGPLGVAAIAGGPTIISLGIGAYQAFKSFQAWRAKREFKHATGKDYAE